LSGSVYVCNNAKFIELRIFFLRRAQNGNSLYNGKKHGNDNLGDQNLEDSIKNWTATFFMSPKCMSCCWRLYFWP